MLLKFSDLLRTSRMILLEKNTSPLPLHHFYRIILINYISVKMIDMSFHMKYFIQILRQCGKIPSHQKNWQRSNWRPLESILKEKLFLLFLPRSKMKSRSTRISIQHSYLAWLKPWLNFHILQAMGIYIFICVIFQIYQNTRLQNTLLEVEIQALKVRFHFT